MNQQPQPPEKKEQFPLWTKIAIGIIGGITLICLLIKEETRSTLGMLFLVAGIVGFLWSGFHLVVNLFFVAEEMVSGSKMHRLFTPRCKRYFIFFVLCVGIAWIGAILA